MNLLNKNAFFFSLGVILVLFAATSVVRSKSEENTNQTISLTMGSIGDYCTDTESLKHQSKLENGLEENRVYFVGCGGFF